MRRVFYPVRLLPEQEGVLSFEAAEPAGSDVESLHWGSTWVWLPEETTMIRSLEGLKNRKQLMKMTY